MRLVQHCDGRPLSRPSHRPGHAAPAFFHFAQRRHAGKPDDNSARAAAGKPPSQTRHGASARAAPAVYPALGHGPLCGTYLAFRARRRHTRPGGGRAQVHVQGAGQALHRCGAGTDAIDRLCRQHRTAQLYAARADGPHQRHQARPGPSADPGIGAGTGIDCTAVLPAVGDRPRVAGRRPRPARQPGAGVRHAGADPGSYWRRAFLVRHGA